MDQEVGETMAETAKGKKDGRRRPLMLAGFLLLLLVSTFYFAQAQHEDGSFTGTDEEAAALIRESGSAYEPWFSGLWETPGALEGPLFALQAALGAGVVGYCLGYLRGRRKGEEGKHGDY